MNTMKPLQFLLIFFIAFMHVNASLFGQETIKLKTLKSKPVIEARLNGRIAYFLLDTGSDITILHMKGHKKFKFQYYLRRGQHLANSLSNKNLDLHEGYDVHLTIGARQIKAKFFVYDMSTVVETIYKTSNLKICGIIGSDVMRSYNFVIDYGQRQITVNK